jgi:hypothetical protein
MRNVIGAARAPLEVLAVLAVLAVSAACGGGTGGAGGGLFRQYEYEEEVYVSLDGTATVYVHASLPALNALRGTSFATAPNAPLDREAVRAFFTTPVTRVNGQVNASRRSNRRFIHVELQVDDIRRLGEAAPFAWSTYDLKRDGNLVVYRQSIGSPVATTRNGIDKTGWNGQEIVAFRLHLPSRIQYHNTGRDVGRGNILVWEQPLSERLRGTPLVLDARMDPESILFRTLWLFGWTLVAVAIMFGLVIWWIVRRAPAEQRAA